MRFAAERRPADRDRQKNNPQPIRAKQNI